MEIYLVKQLLERLDSVRLTSSLLSIYTRTAKMLRNLRRRVPFAWKILSTRMWHVWQRAITCSTLSASWCGPNQRSGQMLVGWVHHAVLIAIQVYSVWRRYRLKLIIFSKVEINRIMSTQTTVAFLWTCNNNRLDNKIIWALTFRMHRVTIKWAMSIMNWQTQRF